MAGGFDQPQPARHRQRVALVRRTVFGIAAADHERHHAVAPLPSLDAGAERDHLAGDLEPGNVRRPFGRRIKSLALHHVRPIDAGGGDLDQHLAFGRRRSGRRSGTSTSGPPAARIAITVIWAGNQGIVERSVAHCERLFSVPATV